MSIKRRTRIEPTFSMSSMTDIIFLLLIFFMITSTMVAPNAIKVLLPQSKKQSTIKAVSHVVIDKNLNMYVALVNEEEKPVTLAELPCTDLLNALSAGRRSRKLRFDRRRSPCGLPLYRGENDQAFRVYADGYSERYGRFSGELR